MNQDAAHLMDDELDADELAIALATLSDGEYPTTFSDSPSSFAPEDVDWDTNSWLSYIQRVHEWLYIEGIPTSLGAEKAAVALFESIGVANTEECFTLASGVALITPVGCALLESRASAAQKWKDCFDEDIADGFGRVQATRKWLTRWEDEPDTSSIAGFEVHAEVDVWKIKDFKDEAESGRLELNPSYQRDVVWSNGDSQKLLDSVLRGIPLPSIILNKRKNSKINEIVDGKQRLTAILRFIGHHPAGVKYAREISTPEADLDLFRNDYRAWRRKLGVSPADERKYCLPFPLSRYAEEDSLSHLSRKYYCEIRLKSVTIQGSQEDVEDLFERSSKAYQVPVIVYKDTDIHQIHKVFGLYNKQGKQLNAEELRNAIYHHLDLTKLFLALSGDNDQPAELVPFASELPMNVIPSVLHELQVGVGRFHRTKLTSWVSSIILHRPKRSESSIATPSTAGYINSLLEHVTQTATHPMHNVDNLKTFAQALVDGAALLNELRGEEEAFAPSFTHKRSEGARWEDLPAVAAWTACTLAVLAGRSHTDAADVCDQVRKVTEGLPPLEKQQSRSQWVYIARTVFALLQAMDVDTDKLDVALRTQLACSCIASLRAIADIDIVLR